jgi:hypothetical protein
MWSRALCRRAGRTSGSRAPSPGSPRSGSGHRRCPPPPGRIQRIPPDRAGPAAHREAYRPASVARRPNPHRTEADSGAPSADRGRASTARPGAYANSHKITIGNLGSVRLLGDNQGATLTEAADNHRMAVALSFGSVAREGARSTAGPKVPPPSRSGTSLRCPDRCRGELGDPSISLGSSRAQGATASQRRDRDRAWRALLADRGITATPAPSLRMATPLEGATRSRPFWGWPFTSSRLCHQAFVSPLSRKGTLVDLPDDLPSMGAPRPWGSRPASAGGRTRRGAVERDPGTVA